MPIRLSKRRVYPAPPKLDPAVAPWSAPRGYETTMREEAAALKAAARAGRPPVKVVGTRAFLRSPVIGANDAEQRERQKPRPPRPRTPNCFVAIGTHLRDIWTQVAANFKVNSQKLVAKIFCINVETD